MKETHPPCHGFTFGATSPGRKKHRMWRWGLGYVLPGRGNGKAGSESVHQVQLGALLHRAAHTLCGVPSKARLWASSACGARGPALPRTCYVTLGKSPTSLNLFPHLRDWG